MACKPAVALTYPQPVGLVHGGGGVIAEHLQGDTLLGHGHDGLLVHVGVVDAHATEDGERLHKVLVVLGKVLQGNRDTVFKIRDIRVLKDNLPTH